jgi:hypothetical protein
MSQGMDVPSSRTRAIFHYVPHPRIRLRQSEKPAKTADERGIGVNGKIGVFITMVVGTMWAAYIFTVLALISLPSVLSSKNLVLIVGWIAQTFLQLVLLPIIIVGQNVQARAADKRSEQTYSDAEAILQECLQLQAHLEAQDKVLDDVVRHLAGVSPQGA